MEALHTRLTDNKRRSVTRRQLLPVVDTPVEVGGSRVTGIKTSVSIGKSASESERTTPGDESEPRHGRSNSSNSFDSRSLGRTQSDASESQPSRPDNPDGLNPRQTPGDESGSHSSRRTHPTAPPAELHPSQSPEYTASLPLAPLRASSPAAVSQGGGSFAPAVGAPDTPTPVQTVPASAQPLVISYVLYVQHPEPFQWYYVPVVSKMLPPNPTEKILEEFVSGESSGKCKIASIKTFDRDPKEGTGPGRVYIVQLAYTTPATPPAGAVVYLKHTDAYITTVCIALSKKELEYSTRGLHELLGSKLHTLRSDCRFTDMKIEYRREKAQNIVFATCHVEAQQSSFRKPAGNW